MRILFIGDIIGQPGRRAAELALGPIRKEFEPDFVIANAENSAHGKGITRNVYRELTEKLQIDALTSGNHLWDQKEFIPEIGACPKLIRPANFHPKNPGNDRLVLEKGPHRLGVFNLMGRVFMEPYDDPFRISDQVIRDFKDQGIRCVLMDFHGEATSEKQAIGWALDGRISAVMGTHTHVQTADERILPNGTAYITDAGMTGAQDSILGMNRATALYRFTTMMPQKLEPPDKYTGPLQFNGVIIDINEKGQAERMERVYKVMGGSKA